MQIWIEPSAKGLEPRYADQPILGEVENEWKLILSPDGREGSMAIRQDVELRTVQLTEGSEIIYATERQDRGFWIFVVEGEAELDGDVLKQGDALALSGVQAIELKQSGNNPAKVLLFDLPL